MRSLARNLLADRSFDIEFHGYLTNHVKHAIFALDKLQAPASRIQEYWDTYTKSTPYNLPLHKVEKEWDQIKPATLDQWKEWRGRKVHWQEQVAFMNQEIEARQGDIRKLVADFAPAILDGMMGALTHTIIHLGWAIDASSPWMVAEGLAYMNFAHVGIKESQLAWDRAEDEDPMQSFLRVAETWHAENLGKVWIAKAKAAHDETFHPELVSAGFQWDFAKVADQPHRIATELPTWITRMNAPDVWESLYRAVVNLFLATRDKQGHGNFLVLHLVTSLWGLEKTLEVINDERTSQKALGYYYAGLVCLLSTASSGFPQKESLLAVQDQFPLDAVDPEDFDWTATITAGIAQEEEHNIKLVYVMRELWHRYNHWTGFSVAAKSFTLTPNIGPQQSAFTQ